MNSKIVYSVAALLILGGGALYFNRNKQAPALQPNTSQTEINQAETLRIEGVATPTVSNQVDQKGTAMQKPEMQIDSSKKYQAILTTDKGAITIDLNASLTPITVNNFIYLASQNFYNNTVFHRTIQGFMIQGGDPTGTGRGGPGYQFDDEPFEGQYSRGIVAMANAGPNTNGSQFFIMHKDYPLPPNYVIFGKVSAGMDVVDAIATAPTKQEGEGSSPVTPAVIESVKIVEQ